MTEAKSAVSEELVQKARSAIEDGGGWFISSDDMRLALNAIANSLRAEGMRMAGEVEINGVKLKYYDMLAWLAIEARAAELEAGEGK